MPDSTSDVVVSPVVSTDLDVMLGDVKAANAALKTARAATGTVAADLATAQAAADTAKATEQAAHDTLDQTIVALEAALDAMK